jgi:hypothetical protein
LDRDDGMSTPTALRPGAPPRPARSRAGGGVGVGVGAVAALTGAMLLLLVASGVDATQAARVTLVVVVQVVTGAVLWLLARGPAPAYATEVVGMGLALGTLTSLLGTQALLPAGWGGLGWLLPTALVAVALAVPAVRRRLRAGEMRRPTLGEVGGVTAGVAVGLVFVRSYWQAHPLDWTGWWRYYVDIPHHESLSVSLATWGPWDNNLVVGEPIRYHWFAHGWAGAVSNASSAEPFVVMTRALPLVAVIGTVCLVWAWARRLSDRPAAPVLAVLVTVLAVDVATWRELNFTDLFAISPSLGVGALWFLGTALVFTEYLRGRIAWGFGLLALLAVGCMGGKTSFAAVLSGGVGLTAFVSLWLPEFRARAWKAFGVVTLALAGAFAALILGSTGNLRLEAGASAVVYGVLPNDTWLGFAVGTGAVALVMAAKWAGLAALPADRRSGARPEAWFGAGVAVAGLFLMAVLGHPGASQLYFPVSAGVVVGVVSAWGLAEALGSVSRGWIAGAALIGAAVGAVSSADIPDRWAWRAPYLVWLVPLVLAVAVVLARLGRRVLRRPGRPRAGVLVTALSVVAWCLVTASVTTGLIAAVGTVRAAPPAQAAPQAAGAWTDSHEEALRWLRQNTPQDDVVATNRQCSAPQVGAAACGQARWFLTAALGHRRMYVEGADYAAGMPHPAWVEARVEVSRRFVDAPTRADARVLWDAGVRWVVVDLASTATRDWAPFAERVFADDTTEILRLSRP